MRRSSPSPVRDLPAWAAASYAVAQLVAASRFFATPYPVWLNVDEGTIAAFALRLLEGRFLPYVDAVSQRGPLLYWAAALASRVGDPLSFAPIRALALVLWALVAIATFAAGALAKRPLAGAIGALSLPIVCLGAMTPWDGVAYNGELLLDAFAMLALVGVVAALGPPARRRRAPSLALLAASGVLVALAALAKQVGVVAAAPLAAWVVAAALARRDVTAAHGRRMVAAFGLGFAAPIAAVVALYAVAGELHRLVYWSMIYNAKVYMHPFADAATRARTLRGLLRGKLLLLALGAPLFAWALRRPFASARGARDFARAVDDDGFLVTVALGAAASVGAAVAMLRDYPHYYVQALPWVGLLVGLAVEEALSAGRRRVGFAAQALVLAPLAWLAWFAWASQHLDDLRARTEGRAFQDPRNSPICAYVAAHTRPDERLFVWGFEPDLYVACRRRPASRYVFTAYVAGFIPWFTAGTVADDDALAAPGSRQELLADLDASRPPVIVDAGSTMSHRPMARYPVLAHWLDDHYCDDGVHGGIHTYLRRGEKSQCPAHH